MSVASNFLASNGERGISVTGRVRGGRGGGGGGGSGCFYKEGERGREGERERGGGGSIES